MMKNTILIHLAFFVSAVMATAQTTTLQRFKRLSFAEIQHLPRTDQRIDGTDQALPEGTILVYETNAHRLGKLLVHKVGHDLEIDWTTYQNNGKVYRSGRNAVIRGTYQFDLDAAAANPKGYDLWWQQVDGQQRYLVPQNGAQFGVVTASTPADENDGNIYPYPLKKIKLSNHVEIAYADEGGGDYTLLFIHGLGGYHQVWKKNMDELRKNNRCIALDLPGCGKSAKGDYPFTIEFNAEVVSEFITSLRLKNVVLIGHSLGGQIAVSAALKNIPEVKKLVLLAPSGLVVLDDEEKSKVEEGVRPEKIKGFTDLGLKYAFGLGYASGKLPSDAAFMLKYRLNIKKRLEYFDYFCQMMYKTNMAAVNEPVIDRLNGIRVPTLILWGKEDKTLRPELAEKAKKRIPNCEVQITSPCGHMLQWECTEEVNSAIRQFISPVQQSVQEAPIAIFVADQTSCIAPCTIQFTNLSENADHFVWTVDGTVVSREKNLAYTFKKAEGFRIKLVASQGNRSDAFEMSIKALGE